MEQVFRVEVGEPERWPEPEQGDQEPTAAHGATHYWLHALHCRACGNTTGAEAPPFASHSEFVTRRVDVDGSPPWRLAG
jgi:hypothetical protein